QIGVWEWNLRTGAMTWSTALEILHGLEPGSFGGTQEAFLQQVHPEDREMVKRQLTRAFELGLSCHCEYRVLLPDRSVRWVESRGKVFFDDAGQPVRLLGAFLDVSQRKQNEQSALFLAAAQKDLVQVERRKDEFLAILAHELRSPLAPMRHGLEVMRLL